MAATSTIGQTIHAKIKVWAHINTDYAAYEEDASESDYDLPVASIKAQFCTNSFPTAHISIPVGKLAASDTEDAILKGQELIEQFKESRKIYVWAQIDGDFAKDIPWPEEKIYIFQGTITGSSLIQTANSLAVNITAVHWMANLDATSALSSNFAKGSNVFIHTAAVTDANGSHVGASPSETFQARLKRNVWTEALKEKLCLQILQQPIKKTLEIL